ncbi:hypothetical protein V1499_23020 (plasmid) [Neobacillus sp. SCS-31]|uniref:hypothetical protein n=1 Tax=Neobacillus oceani TaxID=3115292 RepID=UPI003905D20D
MKRTLAAINADYERILSSDLNDYNKAIELAALMTEMEGSYQVPMLKNEEWEKANKPVIALYRKISRSRKFD